jgi:hypothetical protein
MDEMDGACNMHGKTQKGMQCNATFLVENLRDPGTDLWIMLNLIRDRSCEM